MTARITLASSTVRVEVSSAEGLVVRPASATVRVEASGVPGPRGPSGSDLDALPDLTLIYLGALT